MLLQVQPYQTHLLTAFNNRFKISAAPTRQNPPEFVMRCIFTYGRSSVIPTWCNQAIIQQYVAQQQQQQQQILLAQQQQPIPTIIPNATVTSTLMSSVSTAAFEKFQQVFLSKPYFYFDWCLFFNSTALVNFPIINEISKFFNAMRKTLLSPASQQPNASGSLLAPNTSSSQQRKSWNLSANGSAAPVANNVSDTYCFEITCATGNDVKDNSVMLKLFTYFGLFVAHPLQRSDIAKHLCSFQKAKVVDQQQ